MLHRLVSFIPIHFLHLLRLCFACTQHLSSSEPACFLYPQHIPQITHSHITPLINSTRAFNSIQACLLRRRMRQDPSLGQAAALHACAVEQLANKNAAAAAAARADAGEGRPCGSGSRDLSEWKSVGGRESRGSSWDKRSSKGVISMMSEGGGWKSTEGSSGRDGSSSRNDGVMVIGEESSIVAQNNCSSSSSSQSSGVPDSSSLNTSLSLGSGSKSSDLSLQGSSVPFDSKGALTVSSAGTQVRVLACVCMFICAELACVA